MSTDGLWHCVDAAVNDVECGVTNDDDDSVAAAWPKTDTDNHLIYKPGDFVTNFEYKRKCKRRLSIIQS